MNNINIYGFQYVTIQDIVWLDGFRMFLRFIRWFQSVVELLACWQGQFGRHRNGYIWTATPHSLMLFFGRK